MCVVYQEALSLDSEFYHVYSIVHLILGMLYKWSFTKQTRILDRS